MREATKKQLDLQEVLFSKMVVRSEPALHKHLQHAVQVTHYPLTLSKGLSANSPLHLKPPPPPLPLALPEICWLGCHSVYAAPPSPSPPSGWWGSLPCIPSPPPNPTLGQGRGRRIGGVASRLSFAPLSPLSFHLSTLAFLRGVLCSEDFCITPPLPPPPTVGWGCYPCMPCDHHPQHLSWYLACTAAWG